MHHTGAGDRVGLLLPTAVAADVVLADAVNVELQAVMAGLRGDPPIERERPFARHGGLRPATLAVADTTAVRGIPTVVVRLSQAENLSILITVWTCEFCFA